MSGYRCTIHWEHEPAFSEAFPDLQLTHSLFEIDRDRLTCAGGIAALDMMHAMIRNDHGQALAAAVSDWFIQTRIRSSADRQRLPVRDRYVVSNPKLTLVLERMGAELEHPVDRRQLATLAGVSVRQLERLFSAQLRSTINAQYKRIRLERARTLLAQTALPILEIALICGFRTASRFLARLPRPLWLFFAQRAFAARALKYSRAGVGGQKAGALDGIAGRRSPQLGRDAGPGDKPHRAGAVNGRHKPDSVKRFCFSPAAGAPGAAGK